MGIWWSCLTHSVVVKIKWEQVQESTSYLVKRYTDVPYSTNCWSLRSPLIQRPSASYRMSPDPLLLHVTLSPGFSARRLSREEAEKPWELLSVMRRWSLALCSLPTPSLACDHSSAWPGAALGRRIVADREPDSGAWSTGWERCQGRGGSDISGERSFLVLLCARLTVALEFRISLAHSSEKTLHGFALSHKTSFTVRRMDN